ncbi:hypothetical protein D187_008104 [Cystobacter fuscus DSM 2262]|uniref:Uncharacterized protein n=1 Tax=Cystobacter fuscus (strain ATCC 25194 / DSM 2262 / NBRC 100088 / M29) TaxID=1242864 RepID=S9Q3E9_CYSF2|nr:hypothetical protein D187_008104 [Cystobacter fuscus DSM 2262]
MTLPRNGLDPTVAHGFKTTRETSAVLGDSVSTTTVHHQHFFGFSALTGKQ